MQKFKVGDKVMWDNDVKDWGVVTKTTNDDFAVKWSTCSNTYTYSWGLHFAARITLRTDNQCSQLSEQQAVALLLSLGYTISKQPMVTNISNKT